MTKMFIISDAELDSVVQKKQTEVLHFIYALAQSDSSKNFSDLLNYAEEWILSGKTDFTHSSAEEDLATPEGAAAFNVEAEDVQVDEYDLELEDTEVSEDAEDTTEPEQTDSSTVDYDYETDERPASETTSLEEVATIEEGVITVDSDTPEDETETAEVEQPATAESEVETPQADSTSFTPEPEQQKFNLHKLLKEARSIDKL